MRQCVTIRFFPLRKAPWLTLGWAVLLLRRTVDGLPLFAPRFDSSASQCRVGAWHRHITGLQSVLS